MEPTPSRSGIPSVPKELNDDPVAPTNPRGISRPIHGKPLVSDDKQRSRRYRGEAALMGEGGQRSGKIECRRFHRWRYLARFQPQSAVQLQLSG
jgi:hypothetical protein